MIASAIMKGAASVGTLVNNIVSGIYQMKAQGKAQDQAYDLAMIQRGDTLNQNAITNQLNQDQLLLQRSGLGFNMLQANRNYRMQQKQMKMQGEQFDEQIGFQKEQYADQKAAGIRGEKRQVAQQGYQNLLSFINQDQNLKNQVIQRMGA